MTRGVSVCGKATPSSEGGFRKQQYPSRCVWDSVELVRVHEHLEEDLTVFALSESLCSCLYVFMPMLGDLCM